MLVLWGSLAGFLIYLEAVYHFSGFGWSGYYPIYTFCLIAVWSGAAAILVGVVRGRLKKVIFYLFLWFFTVWACVQLVYLRIFKQPLLWEAAVRGGGDALTNYWREALMGILGALPFLILMLLPGIVAGIVLHKKKWQFPKLRGVRVVCAVLLLSVGIVGEIAVMQIGKYLTPDYYEDYTEFFAPLGVAEEMGFLPMLQRDSWGCILRLSGDVSGELGTVTELLETNAEEAETEESVLVETDVPESDSEGTDSAETADREMQEPVITEHRFEIDFETLRALADNEEKNWLADYIEKEQPTNTNEYTGIFEGYNLIYLTAEGFSTYAVREDLTPTLYRLANSGFVFENYYVPLWQTSTSDGEYINCTGLIPDGQFSMRKSASNDMAYCLPAFFEAEGVKSYAYHNNSLSYYDRYLTHPNLGYDFKCSKLGTLSEEEWGDRIFLMDNPNAWPASDLEMMQGTIPEYLDNERFHVYYLTVSGHMYYNFKGNAMSAKNREAVDGLELSENARAYLACNIELDKALQYLLERLEEAGQLEKTVICMSADHYPYAMSTEQYEELAGKSLSEGMDLYRNTLILWNAGMEAEPVHVEKVCGSMDILPTLLNLFGFSYDSRMYAGRDIFSDEEGLVIFNDRSFVTDSVTYRKKGKETVWRKDADGNDLIADDRKEAYFSEVQQEVKDRYQFSAYFLRENYYSDIKQALEQTETPASPSP